LPPTPEGSGDYPASDKKCMGKTASKNSEGDGDTKLTIYCKDEYVSITSMLSAEETDNEFHKTH
jgi:hypothetical protein